MVWVMAVLPLAFPTYLSAYIYVELLDASGPLQTSVRALSPDALFPEIRSSGGAIAIFSIVLFPYVYLPARVAFARQSADVIEVARTLGTGSLLASRPPRTSAANGVRWMSWTVHSTGVVTWSLVARSDSMASTSKAQSAATVAASMRTWRRYAVVAGTVSRVVARDGRSGMVVPFYSAGGPGTWPLI